MGRLARFFFPVLFVIWTPSFFPFVSPLFAHSQHPPPSSPERRSFPYTPPKRETSDSTPRLHKALQFPHKGTSIAIRRRSPLFLLPLPQAAGDDSIFFPCRKFRKNHLFFLFCDPCYVLSYLRRDLWRRARQPLELTCQDVLYLPLL